MVWKLLMSWKKNECLTSSNWTPDSFKVCLKNFLIMPCKWEGLSNLLSCLMPLMMRLFLRSELSISSILWALFWLFLKWKKKMLNRSQLSFLMLVVYQMWFKRNFGFGLVDPITKGASSRGAAPPSNEQTRKISFFWTGTQNNQFHKIFYVRRFAKMCADELIKYSTFSWKNELCLVKNWIQIKTMPPTWF